MGIFKRWMGKKERGMGLDEPLLKEEGLLDLDEPFPKDNLGLDEGEVISESSPEATVPSYPGGLTRRPFSATQVNTANTPQRELELINSKLDTLKAILNSIEQRIANLERIAGVEQQKKMPW